MIALTHDRIFRDIPFILICSTYESARWNTGKRRKLWKEFFTERERQHCTRLFRLAHEWYLVKGVPDKVRIKKATYNLWQKLGEFCVSF